MKFFKAVKEGEVMFTKSYISRTSLICLGLYFIPGCISNVSYSPFAMMFSRTEKPIKPVETVKEWNDLARKGLGYTIIKITIGKPR